MFSRLPINKLLGSWFLMISTGTASFLTISEYLKSKRIGLQFSDSETKKNTLPNTLLGWRQNYSYYQNSNKPNKKNLTFEEYQEHKKKSWISKNRLPENVFYGMFPFANPSVDQFEKIITINSNQNTFNNISKANYFICLFFLLKDKRFFPRDIVIPYVYISCFATAFGTNVNLVIKDKLENHLKNNHQNSDSWKMFKYTLTSLSFYACILHFGMKIVNPLAVIALKAEEILLSKTLFKQYSAIIASSILVSSCSSYIKSAKSNSSETNVKDDANINEEYKNKQENDLKEILKAKIYANMDVNTVEKIYWGLQGLPLLIFMSIIRNPAMKNLSNPMFKSSRLAFLLYFLTTGTEVYNNYNSGTGHFSDYFLRLVFLTSAVVGFSGFRIMSKTVLK
ncbi:hypothetical protein SteCoe_11324 [Stentor coeruleus]|uniref:Uncharacterized protein n=1 Tax=Stentor coeruleus TaxID=5963 RepID=A0A1R2CDE9_9CILI|nr:hypothetical protein SteCoe_11324 [Stentor coeruleus]